ncbi:MAG: hypothetical protein IPM14_05870 [bacterium]|nr:hypothetical protein [bacterium]
MIISVYPKALAEDWALVANMQRFYKISLSDSLGFKYLLTTKDNTQSMFISDKYRKIHPPEPSRYILFEKKN